MHSKIADYAMIGNCLSAALIDHHGTMAWLCLPRFDSDACFAELLGTRDNGAWRLGPVRKAKSTRRYRHDTLILETTFENEDGSVTVIDAMIIDAERPTVVRIVRGDAGQMRMCSEIGVRFGYGHIKPVIEAQENGLRFVAGPDAIRVTTRAPWRVGDRGAISEMSIAAGEQVAFVLDWSRSFLADNDAAPEAEAAVSATEQWWQAWIKKCRYRGPHAEAVVRSLITLKALTFAPSGGIAAAATTSLPEKIGGSRNWDYRMCWLRDATFTLYSLRQAGYIEEAQAWRQWLVRAVAGEPGAVQILYSLTGRRRFTEIELAWLDGFAGSKPVRIGNAASEQFQLDVFGEIIDAIYQGRRTGIGGPHTWPLERSLIEHVSSVWSEPDEGIWEVRGPRQHFVHSKVMAWVAVDRGIRNIEEFKVEGPLSDWLTLRERMHAEICREGFDRKRGAFMQAFGSQQLDASVLILPLVGFISPHDPRWLSTIAAIEKNLCREGFVMRYDTAEVSDGLPPGEGVFLPCTFWLADNFHLIGREAEARELFERLLALRNDVGLLAEEYDPDTGELLGNFPQAFTHVGLINTAFNLSPDVEGPAEHRAAHALHAHE